MSKTTTPRPTLHDLLDQIAVECDSLPAFADRLEGAQGTLQALALVLERANETPADDLQRIGFGSLAKLATRAYDDLTSVQAGLCLVMREANARRAGAR